MAHPYAKTPLDRLPPNSMEAERGVLGCVLLHPEELPKIVEAVRGEEPFYDLRHGATYHAMLGLHGEGKPIDLITLHQRLIDTGRLQDAGGLAYVSTLPDEVPSAANLFYYLDIVLEKLALRKMVKDCVETVAKAYEFEGGFENLLANLETRVLAIKTIARREKPKPELLRKPADYAEEIFNRFFHLAGATEPGLELPIDFKFKVRPGEMTLVSGDDGSGKSTLLAYFLLHLAAQGQQCMVATFEESPDTYFWTLISQLLGASRFPNEPEYHRLVSRAISWVNERFDIYDFQGIADWRQVLDTFRYAARTLGRTIFKLDNAMRIGVAEDDLGAQQIAAGALASFAKNEKVHLFTVLHENKSGDGKNKIRASKLWTANSHNIFRVLRNTEKGEKIAKLEAAIEGERGGRVPDHSAIAEHQKAISDLCDVWDAGVILMKQRERRTRQNSSRYFWYDDTSFQYRVHWDEAPVDWFARWAKPVRRTPAPRSLQPLLSETNPTPP